MSTKGELFGGRHDGARIVLPGGPPPPYVYKPAEMLKPPTNDVLVGVDPASDDDVIPVITYRFVGQRAHDGVAVYMLEEWIP